MSIINLTQHVATQEQKMAGVVDLQGKDLEALKKLLTFENLPSKDEIQERALAIVEMLPAFFDRAMIGGAPYLMGALEKELKDAGIRPVYSFTKRESVEEVQADGSVRKTAVFKHVGWVEV